MVANVQAILAAWREFHPSEPELRAPEVLATYSWASSDSLVAKDGDQPTARALTERIVIMREIIRRSHGGFFTISRVSKAGKEGKSAPKKPSKKQTTIEISDDDQGTKIKGRAAKSSRVLGKRKRSSMASK